MIRLLLYMSDSMSERFFVGAIQGLIGCVIAYFWLKRNKKKETKRYKKELKESIYKDSCHQITISPNTIEIECYSSLYNELKEKCNPANYMTPYNAEKVEFSNQIYSQLDINKKNIYALIQLRNSAINKLGLSFSAKELFDKLSNIYNPTNYTGEKYDADKLHVANQVYAEIQSKSNDIIALEDIAKKNGLILAQKSDTIIQNITEQELGGDIYENSNTLNIVGKITIYACILFFLIILCLFTILLSS